jgi:hypothetical protein
MHPDVEKYLDQFKWINDEKNVEEESYAHSSDEEYPYSGSKRIAFLKSLKLIFIYIYICIYR